MLERRGHGTLGPVRKLCLGIVLVVGLLLSGCVSAPPTTGPDDRVSGWSSAGQPTASGEQGDPSECEYVANGEAARPVELPPMTDVVHTGSVEYTLTTNEGPIVITMDRAAAPCTINSFVSLVKQGFYDDTKCHRLADSGLSMLQCGDPTGTGSGGPGYTFADEVSPDASYPAGTVAMANAGEDTNGSQFFLVYRDSALDPNYTVFGHIDAAGLNVLEKIATEGHDNSYGDGSGRPNNPATIVSVKQTGESTSAPSASSAPTASSSGR